MLDHLKRRVAGILATTKTVTLSTAGPAGIQVHRFRCEADRVHLYLLVPGTSDHLFNLEDDPVVVASTSGWQLRGAAQVRQLSECPDDLLLSRLPEAVGCVLVQIRPLQLQIYQQTGWGFSETIDFDLDFHT